MRTRTKLKPMCLNSITFIDTFYKTIHWFSCSYIKNANKQIIFISGYKNWFTRYNTAVSTRLYSSLAFG